MRIAVATILKNRLRLLIFGDSLIKPFHCRDNAAANGCGVIPYGYLYS